MITSLGAGQHLFDRENVSEALVARRRRPMLFIDAAIPSDVDPLVNDLEDAFVYSLDDLERIALEGRFQRDEAATEAEAIIETELREYVRAVAERVQCLLYPSYGSISNTSARIYFRKWAGTTRRSTRRHADSPTGLLPIRNTTKNGGKGPCSG